MAIKINTKEQIATVEHPDDSSVKVFIRRIPRMDLLRMQTEFERGTKLVALTTPEGEPLRGEDGKVLTERVTSLSVDSMLRVLQKAVTGWDGVQNESGMALPFHKDRLELLFDPALDITEPGDGSPAFGVYVMQRALEGKTFGDDDPGN